jgi:hypothetical protein
MSAWASSTGDPISKITRAKWSGGVTQVGESCFASAEALSSNPSPAPSSKRTPKQTAKTATKQILEK